MKELTVNIGDRRALVMTNCMGLRSGLLPIDIGMIGQGFFTHGIIRLLMGEQLSYDKDDKRFEANFINLQKTHPVTGDIADWHSYKIEHIPDVIAWSPFADVLGVPTDAKLDDGTQFPWCGFLRPEIFNYRERYSLEELVKIWDKFFVTASALSRRNVVVIYPTDRLESRQWVSRLENAYRVCEKIFSGWKFVGYDLKGPNLNYWAHYETSLTVNMMREALLT